MFSIGFETVQLESTAANVFSMYIDNGRRKRSVAIPISPPSSSMNRGVEASYPRMKRCRRSCNLSDLTSAIDMDPDCDFSDSSSSLSSSYSAHTGLDYHDDVGDSLPGYPYLFNDDIGFRLPLPGSSLEPMSMRGLASALDDQMDSLPSFKRSRHPHNNHNHLQQAPNET
jgi:hypothetical protein